MDDTEEVERRAVDAVLAAERALGREPHQMPFWNPGFGVRSLTLLTGTLVLIEVKGRLAGGPTCHP